MSPLQIEILPAFSDNYIYLLRESKRGTTGVVDPGAAEPVLARLDGSGWKLDWILSTHHHQDHTGGNLELKRRTGCQIAGPAGERESIPGLDVELREGDRFALGEAAAAVLETPGHTRGHISYWFEDEKALFCADTLFSLGCGRVFEGTMAQMWSSLEKLAALPVATRVYCGHEYTQSNARFALTVDPDNPALTRRAAEVDRLRAAGRPTIPSTIGAERETNPFLRAADQRIRKGLGLIGAADDEVFAEIRRRKDRF
jgi:hydroxyacylglutathione hydrolase